MNWKCFYVTVVSLFACCVVACASGVEDVNSLNGKWQVTSTTWGGAADAFDDSFVVITVEPDSVESIDGLTEAVARVEFEMSLGFAGLKMRVNEKFCVMQYDKMKDNYKLSFGYARPIFWQLDEYTCAPKSSYDPDSKKEENDGESQILNSVKYLFRVKLTSENEARAQIYYENAYYEYSRPPENEDKDFVTEESCVGWYCAGSGTFGVGIFEMELKKE